MSRRWVYAAALMMVAIVGIASRVFCFGNLLLDKYLGDAVYAVSFYLALGIVWDRMTPGRKAILTLAFVLAVEAFQLTLIPLEFSVSDSRLLRLAAIVLGTEFAWWDILAYLVGIAGVLVADCWYGKRMDRGA